ncbi:uncharacterized protein N7477_007025 [Penicillium maclennaniae]|uniref:uncharacterized protein n=1 Tax=Penicillium maclennaniae TaxID=1343394 RepID=UPI002540CF6A|nr:uncharacterized protein N7477_007025 [Penicillium maclennaniae]KAJ5668455.1 hypothetical protein N7477_007025 [Penicillium maclennaniae]
MSDSEANARNARTRRKPRTVSSLTAQQIEHKRDLDRKAQRALRQRLKSRMQDLEEDLIRTKTSLSDQGRSLMDEVQSLREENRRLRSCLDSIAQFALDGVPEENNAGHDTPRPDSVPIADDEPISDTPQNPESPAPPSNLLTPGNRQFHTETTNASATMREFARYTPYEQHHRHPAGPSYGCNEAAMPAGIGPPSAEAGDLADPRVSQPTEGNYSVSLSQRLHDSFMARTAPSSVTVNTILQPSTSSGIASVLPKHLPATCPLDQILLDFIASRRTLVAKGVAVNEAVGPSQLCLQKILYPQAAAGSHAISQVLAELLSIFPDVALPEKLGFMFVMFQTIKWQILPTDANYEDIPRWLRPTALQITVPHAAWIDNIPWPRVRDILIEKPEEYPFTVFSKLYSNYVRVNWPYDPMDAASPRGDVIVLNPIFEKHVRRSDNWTVSGQFKEYLPEMAAAIRGVD